MTLSATYRPLPLRSVIAIVVAVWVLVGVAGCWLVRSEPSESNPVHAFFTSLSSELAVNADHTAADCAMSPTCAQAFAMAVLPPSATVLVAPGAAVVVCTIVGSVAHGATPARRGPPHGALIALIGQDILTRLCLARR
jgi:lipoprotein LpqS